MRPKEVENYFKEMARLLAPDGICLATFFLLNKEQQKLQAKGLNSIQFKFGDALFHYANPAIPEIAIAYEEEELIRMLQDAGLRVQNYYYGTWSGKEDGLCFQDMVLIKKN
jgi:hypothetical protein